MAQPKNLSILPIFLTVFIDLLGVGIAIPIFATILLDHDAGILAADASEHIRTLMLGLLIASYPFAQFIGAPILGALSDRYGRKRVLTVSLSVTMIGYVLFGIGIEVGSIALLLSSRFLDGFTGGSISVALSAIADISDKDEKVKNFGLVGMAFGLGFILGPFIGGKLSDPATVGWFTYSTPFWFAAILCAINVLLVQFKFNETLAVRIDTPMSALTGVRNIYRAFSLPRMRTIFAVMFLLTLGFNFFTQFFQVYLIQTFSYTQSQIGNLFAYVGIWIAIAQGVVTPVMSRHFSPEQTLSLSALLLALTLPVLLLPDTAFWLFAILPCIAIFQGLTVPNSNTIISNLADEKSQGEIMGINQSIQSLGMAVPPLVAGVIVTVNHNLPILAGAAITFLAWAVFVAFFGKKTAAGKFHEI